MITIAFLLVVAAVNTAPPSSPPEAMSRIVGTWGSTGRFACDQTPHTISVADGGERLLFNTPKAVEMDDGSVRSVLTYKVLRAERDKLWLFVEGETRKTAAGDPVVWVLIMLDRDTYAWRRTDWAPDGMTKPARRCPK